MVVARVGEHCNDEPRHLEAVAIAGRGDQVDPRRWWIPGSLAGLLIVTIAGGATELRSIRDEVEGGKERNESLLRAVESRPSVDAMRATILETIRPLDTNMAEVRAELRSLVDRVQRIETRSER